MSDITSNVCILAVFIEVVVLIILDALGVDVHAIYLLTNFHGLLVIAVKRATKYIALMWVPFTGPQSTTKLVEKKARIFQIFIATHDSRTLD